MFTVRNVVSCAPAQSGPSVAPCLDVNGVPHAPVIIELSGAPLDLFQASHLFAWSLTIVMSAWLVGVAVGSIIRLIRGA